MTVTKKATYGILLAAIAIMFAAEVSAQHYVGARVGYGGGKGRFYPKVVSDFTWNRYTGGIAWKYYSEQQVIGGVAAELEYQQRSYKYYGRGEVASDTTSFHAYTRTINSISMPLIWQPHIYFFNRHVRVFVNAGFVLSYNTGIGDTFTVFEQLVDADRNKTTSTVTSDYKFVTARDNRWNYGICAGFGVGYLFGRWEIFAEARYYYGMSDIIRNKNKYIFQKDYEQFLRSELDNLYINVGVFFRLGKGGIKAAPLRLNDPDRKKARQGSTTDFRNIKLEM